MDFYKYIKKRFPNNFTNCRVLDLNKSKDNKVDTYGLFDKCTIDSNISNNQDSKEDLYTTVISLKSFDNDQDYSTSIKNVYNSLKEGGLLLMTTTFERKPEHPLKNIIKSKDIHKETKLTNIIHLHPRLLLHIPLNLRNNLDSLNIDDLSNIPLNIKQEIEQEINKKKQKHQEIIKNDDSKKDKIKSANNIGIQKLNEIIDLNSSFSEWNSYINNKDKELYFIGIKSNKNGGDSNNSKIISRGIELKQIHSSNSLVENRDNIKIQRLKRLDKLQNSLLPNENISILPKKNNIFSTPGQKIVI